MLAEPRRPLSLTAAPHVLRCSRARAYALLLRHFPILAWLPRYPVRDWLLGDVLSGLSVAIMQLPQGELLAGPRLGAAMACDILAPNPGLGLPQAFSTLQSASSPLPRRLGLRAPGWIASCVRPLQLLLPCLHLLPVWHFPAHLRG